VRDKTAERGEHRTQAKPTRDNAVSASITVTREYLNHQPQLLMQCETNTKKMWADHFHRRSTYSEQGSEGRNSIYIAIQPATKFTTTMSNNVSQRKHDILPLGATKVEGTTAQHMISLIFSTHGPPPSRKEFAAFFADTGRNENLKIPFDPISRVSYEPLKVKMPMR